MRSSFRTLQRGNAVHDALRRQEDAERPERHADAERRTILRSSFRTLQRGNAVHDALRRQEDAERPERHADAEHRHDSQLDVCLTMSSITI
ncbi:hypothetical protein JN853_23345 [Pseudomonas syringae pv. actinidiae ICMP 9853]|nr:hypothetical protein JN853_23345 [Pseudomonas syringae pv. actinidiae ICMP 9853]AQX60660.1 hypothetical protein B1R35_23180 [Pseudomonas syringae pv. actinidiae]AQX64812.1 hypothetical protein B1F85_12725 [Pseudomonas syringae pv. actinidiae]AYL18866.1 DUF1534 domain-containing protein [Pseudomonas syringae pv. actinidiae]PHZ42771.1 hypothetical protein CS297_03650 [Pseudomonas syringae pv. actinidiae]